MSYIHYVQAIEKVSWISAMSPCLKIEKMIYASLKNCFENDFGIFSIKSYKSKQRLMKY